MKYATGKRSKFISDRSGMAFPYTERVTEWNGSVVHVSEYERKQPQLEPRRVPFEPQALYQPRVDRVEPMEVAVGQSVFPPLKNVVAHAVAFVGTVTVTT
jgi:hypothetical protein